MATGKKKGSSRGSSSSDVLRNVVTSAIGTEALLDLVERLGLVELVMSRVKSKFEDTDIDELFDDVTDYLKRNPEVLVVSLGAITIATGLVVWLNSRREWDGTERRNVAEAPTKSERAPRVTTSTGRVRKASQAS